MTTTLTKPKIERLEFQADKYGNGFDLAQKQSFYIMPRDTEFVVGLFNDHFEATRYLSANDLRTIRDWIDEALREEPKAAAQ
jgi:hypothetical protein